MGSWVHTADKQPPPSGHPLEPQGSTTALDRQSLHCRILLPATLKQQRLGCVRAHKGLFLQHRFLARAALFLYRSGVSGVGVVRIWIFGHSIVHWARMRAVARGFGGDLQLLSNVVVSWIARRGMRWEEFFPTLSNKIAAQGPPKALVIQLGENDLAYRKGVDLMWNIFNDLEELRASYPKLTIIWSSLLERRCWRDATNPVAVSRARRILERSVARRVAAIGGRVIEHPGIQFSKEALYRGDGVHLSDAGPAASDRYAGKRAIVQ
ncbi:uncharacterized protein LOC114602446 [Podarcis muralis]